MKPRLPVRNAILQRRTYEAPAEGRQNKLRLDFNENTSGCSPAVLRALAKITPSQLAMYPEYLAPSRRLARYFSVRPEELLLTNGGDDALRVFFDAFVESGRSILICEPTFPMYRYYAEIYGARIDELHYDPGMNFPLDACLRALKRKPAVFFLANPNNPTGTLLPKPAIKNILRAASHTAVVIDEAYAEFSGLTVIPWVRHFPQLFVARTFSKAAGLAALRLGAVIAGADSVAILRRAMPPFPVNIAALVAAEAALHEGITMRRYIQETKRLREWFAKELHKLDIRTFPSAGNFLLADFGEPGPAIFQNLGKKGILLRERSGIGAGYVRITIGSAAQMKTVLEAIRKLLRKNQPAAV